MHDPQTLAFEIKYPWWVHRPWPKKYRHSGDRKFAWARIPAAEKRDRDPFLEEGYRNTFITIWHVDPEKDGTDDSCGWAWPKLTKAQREILRNTAWHEAHHPHFLCCEAKEWDGTVTEAEALYIGMVLLVARVLRIKLSMDQIVRYSKEAMHIRDCGGFGDVFCYLPGYHSNRKDDNEGDRQDHFTGILCGIARGILDLNRPWWKHPRYHFWHWKFQIHPLQTFKRWAFSRCCKCGCRFSWGYSPITDSWNGTGPRWFRSEKNVYHSDCSHPNDNLCQQTRNT